MAGELYIMFGFVELPHWCLILVPIIVVWILVYVYQVFRYHQAHHSHESGQVPPAFPVMFPILSIIIPLLWDARTALTRYTSYNGHATIAKLAVIPGVEAFLYQDPAVICQIWKQSALLDFRPMSIHFFTSVCGMSRQAASLRLDTPVSDVKTFPGSNLTNESPLNRILNESNHRALTGRGLSTTIQRYRSAFVAKVFEIIPATPPDYPSNDWTQMDDFKTFIQQTCGASMIEAVFGPKLTEMHPNFLESFFEFDDMTPWLLMRLPVKRAYKLRNALLSQLKSWSSHARTTFKETDIYEDGDGDPFWGSAWTRYRHEALAPFFDDDALSSHDLGVLWGALGNTIPCSLMAAVHVLQDPLITDRLRHEIEAQHCIAGTDNGRSQKLDPKRLSKNHLLSSIYAETLRLHVSVSVPVVPEHGELTLGKWRIPRRSYGLIPVACCHTNKDVWNTKGGAHPVRSFWAERFVVDPDDALSGPIRPNSELARTMIATDQAQKHVKEMKPYYSTEGLQGAWIPYGGGKNMCPGRFLSKGVIEFTLAFLVSEFDIELQIDANALTMESKRFGFGADIPTSSIPFRIRRRRSASL